MRASGVLMGISSIPSEYGIGCFSKEAYDFVEYSGKGRTEVLADSSSGSYRIWRFSLSVLFHLCGKSLFIDLEELIQGRASH